MWREKKLDYFYKNKTKFRQKLEYKNQIENGEMTPSIILPCGITTITSLCHCHMARRPFDTWQFFFKFKK